MKRAGHDSALEGSLIILLVIIMVGTIHYTSTSRLKISLFEGLGRDLLVPFQWVFSRAQRFVLHQVEKVQTLRTLKERNAELEELVLSPGGGFGTAQL